MKKISDDEQENFKKVFNELPEDAQHAVCWLLDNFDLAAELCRHSDMTEDEIEKYKTAAREKDDYLLLVLLNVAEMYKNGSLEEQESSEQC